jgi:cytochrome c6
MKNNILLHMKRFQWLRQQWTYFLRHRSSSAIDGRWFPTDLRSLRRSFIPLILGLLVLFTPTPAFAESTAAQLFDTHCAGCHPGGGNIIRRSQTLKLKTLQRNHRNTTAAIAEIITNGKNNMSAFSDRLTPREIDTLATYVLDQANQQWH